jgi:hypothetical protein
VVTQKLMFADKLDIFSASLNFKLIPESVLVIAKYKY